MKILALPLVLAMSLSIASAISEDGPTAIGATSASGMWKVDLKAGQSVGFSLLKKDDKGEYREIAKGNVDGLDGCHHWMAYVSDEGRFAVVNVATSEKDKVIALFSNSGQRKATLAISDVLSKEEMSSLPVRSRCPGHQDWNNGITINDESLVVETLAGRKVTVNLADGKIAKEDAKKLAPMNKDQCVPFPGANESSTNGNHRITLSKDLNLIVFEKGADQKWKRKAEERLIMEHPHPSIIVADDGHFAILNPSGGNDPKENRFFIYKPDGALVCKLTLEDLLGADVSKVAHSEGHMHWLMDRLVSLETRNDADCLVLVTNWERRIIIHLSDGKIAKDEKTKYCPGNGRGPAECVTIVGCSREKPHTHSDSACEGCAKTMKGGSCADGTHRRYCDACAKARGICRYCGLSPAKDNTALILDLVEQLASPDGKKHKPATENLANLGKDAVEALHKKYEEIRRDASPPLPSNPTAEDRKRLHEYRARILSAISAALAGQLKKYWDEICDIPRLYGPEHLRLGREMGKIIQEMGSLGESNHDILIEFLQKPVKMYTSTEKYRADYPIHDRIKMLIMKSLGNHKVQKAVPVLVKMLDPGNELDRNKDKSSQMRYREIANAAALALAEIGDKSAVPALKDAFVKVSQILPQGAEIVNTFPEAIIILGGSEEIEDQLIQAFKGEHRGGKAWAAYHAQKIKGAKVIPYLIDYLRQRKDDEVNAQSALERITGLSLEGAALWQAWWEDNKDKPRETWITLHLTNDQKKLLVENIIGNMKRHLLGINPSLWWRPGHPGWCDAEEAAYDLACRVHTMGVAKEIAGFLVTMLNDNSIASTRHGGTSVEDAEDTRVCDNAARLLQEITGQGHRTQWLEWWEKNKDRPTRDWFGGLEPTDKVRIDRLLMSHPRCWDRENVVKVKTGARKTILPYLVTRLDDRRQIQEKCVENRTLYIRDNALKLLEEIHGKSFGQFKLRRWEPREISIEQVEDEDPKANKELIDQWTNEMKVTVNLADGKIVKEEAKKEGPDASIIQDGTCPGGHVHDEFIGQCLSCKKERAGCGVGVPGIAPVRPRICRACADALGICQLCLKKK